MNDTEKQHVDRARTGANNGAAGASQRYLRIALGMLVALASCALFTNVWRVASDETRRESIAAVRAIEQAQSPGGRIEAIQDLVRTGMIDGKVMIPPLVRVLADPSAAVRVEAVRALGPATSAAALYPRPADNPVTAAVTALTASLDDDEPSVRIAAVQTLAAIAASRNPSGVICPRSLVDAISAMLEDPDATVRASTIASLGLAGPVAAPDPPAALIAALDDVSTFNRAAAAHALARFAARRAD